MIPTVFGALVIVLAVVLWRRGISGMLSIACGMTVLGGSAAILLPALGNTSISPANFALGPALLWILLRRDFGALARACWSNRWLLLFVGYGVVAAFIFPRLFAGQVSLVPMRPQRMVHSADPLGPTVQNLTQSVYLIGTGLAALLAGYAAAAGKHRRDMFRTLMFAAIAHVVFGVMDLVGFQSALELLRNGNYAQLDQNFGSIRRISGSFPEPSNYANYGFALFCLMTELWLRNLWPRLSGSLAAALVVMLVLSTSTTAYVSLAAYGALMIARLIFFSFGRRRLQKGVICFLFVLLASSVVIATMAFNPTMATRIGELLTSLTVGKTQSLSGQERLVWARQGLDAFKASYGLGVGVGSFRSSSLGTAIIGSVGVVGSTAFVLHLLTVVAPWRRSTYDLDLDEDRALAGAAAIAAVLSLVPVAVSGPSPDPGLLFALLSGFALGGSAVSVKPLRASSPEMAVSRRPLQRSS